MTELNKNELLQLSRGFHKVVRQFHSGADLVKYLQTPPGPPYPDDQYVVTLWDIDKQERIWDMELPRWLEDYKRDNADKPHLVMQRGSLVYWKDEKLEILRMGVLLVVIQSPNTLPAALVYNQEGQEELFHPSHLKLFREEEYTWRIMATNADGSYRTVGSFHTQVGVYMRLLDGVNKPASVQWRHKDGAMIRQEPTDSWIRGYNRLNAKMDEIAQETHPEPVSPYRVKSLVFRPKENPLTGKFESYVFHEEKLGSRERVRAYLAGVQDTSMYLVYCYAYDGSMLYEQNADDWLDRYFPGREKPLSMSEETRLLRTDVARIADTLEFLVTTMQEAIELLRTPVTAFDRAFPDKRPGRIYMEEDGIWVEDEDGVSRRAKPEDTDGQEA